jgi:cytochrome c1
VNKFEAMHGLAIKKFGTAAAVADLLAADEAVVSGLLADAVAAGEAAGAKGAFMLNGVGQSALAAAYPSEFAALRSDAALSQGYARFETVNAELKRLVTEWQTMTVAGEQVPNDHSDAEYDRKLIDRIAALHERAAPILQAMAASLPRLARYAARLEAALDRVDDGQIEFVSGAKVSSYHTVWFELHEDLLRILDRKRDE